MTSSRQIYQSRIDKVIDHINNNLGRTISLKELASVACFSPFHFHRIFVAVTGETVNGFTTRARNERAARLLRFSDQSLLEIAVHCGFSSPSTFSRVFKQYFQVTPKMYRNGQAIKSSKICKDLFPISQYHCSLDDQELGRKFPVEIRMLPERKFACIRVTDAFREGVVIDAFAKLVAWTKEVGLYDAASFFGMSKDDPEVTPKGKYQYEACVTIPADFAIGKQDLIQAKTLPACRYAITSMSGDLSEVAAATNYLFDRWLIDSSYECELGPGIEVFRSKENVCNWESFELDIMIPVKALSRTYKVKSRS